MTFIHLFRKHYKIKIKLNKYCLVLDPYYLSFKIQQKSTKGSLCTYIETPPT
jgi:hypothetical protein